MFVFYVERLHFIKKTCLSYPRILFDIYLEVDVKLRLWYICNLIIVILEQNDNYLVQKIQLSTFDRSILYTI